MATFPRLVNKQFNSPIGLYSKQNIEETLNKQSQMLSNGAMGIDFNNPVNSKPSNLANSAVLRMLEEEEQRQRNGQTGSVKRVAWPPPPEENNEEQVEHRVPVQRQEAPVKLHQSPALSRLIPFDAPTQQHAPPQPKVYSPQPQSPSLAIKPISPQPQSPRTPTQIFPPPFPEVFSHTLPKAQPSSYAPVKSKPYAPVPPPSLYSTFPSDTGFRPVGPPSPKPFSPVSAPIFSPPVSQFSGSGNASSSSPYGWAPVSPSATFAPAENQSAEPPPSTITLRPAPPIHQESAPVFTSQPAAQSFRGGVNMRGDQKWPPQSVKEAVAAENEARILLAKGPACRPRKVKKDYSQFFAKNALPHNYPGYRAPPGTQHFEDMTGHSSF